MQCTQINISINILVDFNLLLLPAQIYWPCVFPAKDDFFLILKETILQVPIQQRIQAIDWLSSQPHLLPRTFFSGRSRAIDSPHNTSNGSHPFNYHHLLGVAGVGSAVVFRRLHCFSYNDWASIKRYTKFASTFIHSAICSMKCHNW